MVEWPQQIKIWGVQTHQMDGVTYDDIEVGREDAVMAIQATVPVRPRKTMQTLKTA
jgi:hypothetical protein